MKRWRYALLAVLLLVVIGWIIMIQYINPETIVDWLGGRNSYLAAFILAAVLAGSSFTGASLYPVLATLHAGGMNLYLLALIAAAGAMIGDTIYYYTSNTTYDVLPLRYQKHLSAVNEFLQRYPRLTPFFIFAYAAFMPMPNDVMTVSLGLGDYPYYKMFMPLLAGNAVFYLWVMALLSGVL